MTFARNTRFKISLNSLLIKVMLMILFAEVTGNDKETLHGRNGTTDSQEFPRQRFQYVLTELPRRKHQSKLREHYPVA